MWPKQSQLLNFMEERQKYFEGQRYKLHTWTKLIIQKDVNTCQNCSNAIKDEYRQRIFPNEAHHIIPKHFGGKNTIMNGITLCKFCHNYFDYMIFRHNLDYYQVLHVKSREVRIFEVKELMGR